MSVLERPISPEQITDVPTAARLCQERIGQKVTAWTVGVRDPKNVGRWIGGPKIQDHAVERRLLALANVIAILDTRHGNDANWTRSWLLSPNPRLADESAAEYIRDRESATPVVRAARTYVQPD